MRAFQNETERAVWAAAFANSENTWTAQTAADHADYVVDRLRDLVKAAVPYRSVPEFVGADASPCVTMSSSDVLRHAAVAVRKLAAQMPEAPAAGECGDHSRTYYESLAAELERWVP